MLARSDCPGLEFPTTPWPYFTGQTIICSWDQKVQRPYFRESSWEGFHCILIPVSFPVSHSQSLIPNLSFPVSHSQSLIPSLSFPVSLIPNLSFPVSHSQSLIPSLFPNLSFPVSHSQSLIPNLIPNLSFPVSILACTCTLIASLPDSTPQLFIALYIKAR